MNKKTMELIDPVKGIMKCRVCGITGLADLKINKDDAGNDSSHYGECPNNCVEED